MALFDRYIAVDWSASSAPKRGRDSIWSCDARRGGSDVKTVNHWTRRAAEEWLCDQLILAVAAGQQVLVGLDFPYGYPAGFAGCIRVEGWEGVWEYLERHIRDGDENVSNRFEVAAAVNRRLGSDAPFWGRPAHLELPALPATKLVRYRGAGDRGLPEWRQVEELLRRHRLRPQEVWKLAYTGAVGSQGLVGIPVLRRLRFHEALREVSRVWPFEVRVPELPSGSPAVIHAEIWPSLVPFGHEDGSCKDEQQVRAVVEHWRDLDLGGQLGRLFAAAPENGSVRRDEGWILGVAAPDDRVTSRTVQGPPPTPGPQPTPRARPAVSDRVPQPTPRARPAVSDRVPAGRAPCLCGCGNSPRGKRSRFMPGHDQRISPATGRRFNAH